MSPNDRSLDALRSERELVRAEALAGRGGVALAARLARAFDALLVDRFEAARAAADPGRAALVAVGGYGRGSLAYGSDLDLVLLVDDPEAASVAPFAEALLHPLWDAGIAVGHAVRSVDDFVALARTDVRTATTVLDARRVAGDEDLAREAAARCASALFDGDLGRFLDGLTDEMSSRHRRFGATVYLLEPDVKHSRGGLRDVDIARWALRARFGAASFDEALTANALSNSERDALVDAQEFLWRVRSLLHARSRRRSDRLAFDEQEEAASRLIAVDPETRERDPVSALGEATERLMSSWYRHARAVATTVEHVVARCRPTGHGADGRHTADRVAEGISLRDDTLCFTSPDALRATPSLALRVLELAVARDLPLSAATRDAIAARANDPAWCEALRADEHAASAFRRLLTTSARPGLRGDRTTPVSGTETNEDSVLAEMHDLGLLLAMVPEFAHVTGRVQHDVYHVYTVDVHSVAAVDRLHAIARGDLAEEFPTPAHVLADTDRIEILCIATLLHDIGKSRGGSHARVGADMVPPIAARLGFGPDDRHTIAWLVAEHLTLYHAATRRDLGDPATLASLVDAVRDPWRLRALYLLTVADLSTTSPTAMTSWKARMLDELFRRVDDALSDGPSGADRVEALRAQSLSLAADGDRDAVARLLARMPDRYVLATSPDAIARHARALDAHASTERHVDVSPLDDDPTGELFEVLFVAPDRPGLLSLFAALLYVSRLDVQSAQIYSSRGGAVDVFVVRSSRADPAEITRIRAKLPRQLDDLLDGRADPDALVAAARGGPGIARPEPAVRAEVQLDDDASHTATVVEVFGRDRPGFLYGVTRALHREGVSISLAKVNTEGRRAADTFYVTEADGAKLSAERAEGLREALLAVVRGG